MVRVCSIGGCGCSAISEKLRSNKIDNTKLHLLYCEFIILDKFFGKYDVITIDDIYSPDDICIYVYNDPILSMLSRVRRGHMYLRSSYITNENNQIYHTMKDLDKDFQRRKLHFVKDKTSFEQERLNYYKNILKAIIQDSIEYKRDTYGVLEHFEGYYTNKSKSIIFVDPYRHKDDFIRLNSFLNTDFFKFELKERKSDYKFLYDITPYANEFITFYQDIDKKICKMIDSTR